MIETVTVTPVPRTLLTRKMNVYSASYKGTGLCRLFRSEGAYVMVFNANAVVIGECDEELLNFLRFLGVVTIESENEVTVEGVRCERVYYLERGRVAPVGIEPQSDADMERIRSVMTAAFPETDFSLWYCDYSHMRRRGLCEGCYYEGAFVRIDDYCGKYVITAAASAPEVRGQGNVCRLISSLPMPLTAVSRMETLGFYLRCGFEETGGAYLAVIE